MLVIFGKRPASPWALFVNLAAAVGNEIMDLRGHLGLISYWMEGVKDVANTMLWPTVLRVTLRARGASRQNRWSPTKAGCDILPTFSIAAIASELQLRDVRDGRRRETRIEWLAR